MPACGTVAGKPALGCEAETKIKDIKDLKPERPVGMEKSLQLSAEGFLTLTYKGSSPSDRGEPRVTWTCMYFPSLLFTLHLQFFRGGSVALLSVLKRLGWRLS